MARVFSSLLLAAGASLVAGQGLGTAGTKGGLRARLLATAAADPMVGATFVLGPNMTFPAKSRVSVTVTPVIPRSNPSEAATGVFMTFMPHSTYRNASAMCPPDRKTGRVSLLCLADLPNDVPHYSFILLAPDAVDTTEDKEGSGKNNTIKVRSDPTTGKATAVVDLKERSEGVSFLFVNMFYEQPIVIKHLAVEGRLMDAGDKDITVQGSPLPT